MPRRARTECKAATCSNAGTIECAGCEGAVPVAKYCSDACRTSDWPSHKKYCGKKAYTLDIRIVGSKKPVIKRIVDVPSWYTFEELHYVIQYAFSWENCHLHSFVFYRPRPRCRRIPAGKEIIRFLPHGKREDPWSDPDTTILKEEVATLADVYGEAGKYHSEVESRDTILPLIYLYDFGENWEHLVTFKGEKVATADRPIFSKVTGYPPPEDAGGYDWDSADDDEGDIFAKGRDPDEINPEVMNDEKRWEKRYKACSRMRL
ncbi:MM3350-like domain-containing protein [Schizophyllum amplum]|uniref:MM3350-like domain-containing protein n=1 Tax=Schizophyllum amplum TaxID=97359 RepID=A0A550C3U2_9AGAR|nr:MM3350-like domain-containing protein [Auriculariopsis ampla]